VTWHPNKHNVEAFPFIHTCTPGVIADGAGVSVEYDTQFGLSGGVIAANFEGDPHGAVLSVTMTAAGVITARFTNLTGGEITIGQGTLRVAVLRLRMA
jgi:hypothetical protein